MNEPSPCVAPASPGAAALDLDAAISALRERGAQRLDPVRFGFIEALGRRAAQHSGAARQVMDGKLARALQDCGNRLSLAEQAAQLARTAPADQALAGGAWLQPQASTPLAELLRHTARQTGDGQDSAAAPSDAAHAAHAAAPAELRTLRLFRSTWSKLSVDQQLSESLAKVPENAGPLNSNLLVLRSLKLMQQTSPAYLRHFMAHVDALLWLDQASVGAAPLKKAVLRVGVAQRRSKAPK